MDSNKLVVEASVPGDVLQPLFSASNSCTVENSLECLIDVSRTADGRVNLAAMNILDVVLRLIQSLSFPSGCPLLMSSLKLLRNLCAGEITNQNSFVQQNGAALVLNVLRTAMFYSDPEPDFGIIRMGLQALANVSLAGEEHQRSIWHHGFPEGFLALAKVKSREVCDPLCMIIYTCVDGNPQLFRELCGDHGLTILSEIVQTTAIVGFGEDWLKLLLSRVCIEEPYFPSLFSKLCLGGGGSGSTELEGLNVEGDAFLLEHVFLLRIVSEILNERIREIIVPNDFAMCVLAIFKRSVGVIDSGIICKSGLPTGSTIVDVLGYSLTILRDICAKENQRGIEQPVDAIDMLLSSQLIEFLLCLLRDLEPPMIIKKAMKHCENQGETNQCPSRKCCPYKGFRRDIVAVIGNCAYGRKQVQDEIRQRNGILLILQQCVLDEDNPFLREWGIWSVRNLLEGNEENQRMVAELELQGSVDMPDITGLGLKVEVDSETRCAKLVNIS